MQQKLEPSVRTVSADGADELLRSCIVGIVSGFDRFLHDLVLWAMCESLRGSRSKTTAWSRFQIPLGILPTAAALSTISSDWLEDEIRRVNSFKSFQSYEKAGDALRILLGDDPWDRVAKRLAMKTPALKTRLDIIVDRRNKIAHEADFVPQAIPPQLWPIDSNDVRSAVDFIEQLANAIKNEC